MKIAKLLVAVDFSPASLAGLRRAREIAGDGTIRLFHAIPAYPALYGDRKAMEKLYEDLRERATTQLDDIAQDLRNESSGPVEIEVAIGRPADEIIAAAERCRADMIAVGAHAKGAAGRLLLGTVSEEVARRSKLPVVVVRELAEGTKIARILIALDHDAPSREAAKLAVAVAESMKVPVEGIHVIELPVVPSYAAGPLAFPMDDLTPELLEEIRCSITEETTRALGGKSIPIKFTAGPAAREIVRFARPSDVIVCGTHGRSALGRLAFGSVATKLLRKAPCPVLIVRPVEKPAAEKTEAQKPARAGR
jgi:nucleotide-binding universal stress UspA family protein